MCKRINNPQTFLSSIEKMKAKKREDIIFIYMYPFLIIYTVMADSPRIFIIFTFTKAV